MIDRPFKSLARALLLSFQITRVLRSFLLSTFFTMFCLYTQVYFDSLQWICPIFRHLFADEFLVQVYIKVSAFDWHWKDTPKNTLRPPSKTHNLRPKRYSIFLIHIFFFIAIRTCQLLAEILGKWTCSFVYMRHWKIHGDDIQEYV